jgi:ribonuclease P protein component
MTDFNKQMLPKKYRIDSKLIPTITKKGKKIDKDGLTCRIWYANDMLNAKGAFVVSTKVDKRAVVRNRIKRTFRAAFFQLAKENSIRRANYVFIVKNSEWKDRSSDEVLEFLWGLIT